ncbi:MAG: hypothetical protein RBS78_03245 [Coriobacteriia bacterium]|jgi:Fic family protein|nr:hypothetical protein [Coriobacteriia bacterium]
MERHPTKRSPCLHSDTLRLLEPGGDLYAIMRRSRDSYLPLDEFLSMVLPAGMSPLDSWELLAAMNHATGIDLTIPDFEGREYWYLRTHELADLVTELQCECSEESGLSLQLSDSPNRPGLVRSRIEETIAAAQLDGLGITWKQGSELLRLGRTPRDSTERLVANTLSAIDELDALVDEPFSADLFSHLRELLIKGVDSQELPDVEPRMGLLMFEYTNHQVHERSEEYLEHISAYANHETGHPSDHPVLRALLLIDVIRLYRPLRDLNGQVGRLAFRLYCLKHNLPVLGILPISHMKLQWEGLEGSPRIRWDRPTYHELRRQSGLDFTPYMTLVAQMASAALHDLKEALRRISERDKMLRDMLQADPLINHRQRSVLGRALRNPDAEFRIAYHKTTHNVVYATARADLLGLVDKGYLQVEKRNRAMVFTPVHDLQAKLTIDHPDVARV